MTGAEGGQRRPNLFFAAVHFLLLRGETHPLQRFYSDLFHDAEPPEEAYPAFRDFCDSHDEQLRDLIATRFTQTNEVRRSGQLVLAFLRATELTGHRPFALVEVGASAGLNLLFDHYCFDYAGRILGDPESPLRMSYELRGSVGELPAKTRRGNGEFGSFMAGKELVPSAPCVDALKLGDHYLGKLIPTEIAAT